MLIEHDKCCQGLASVLFQGRSAPSPRHARDGAPDGRLTAFATSNPIKRPSEIGLIQLHEQFVELLLDRPDVLIAPPPRAHLDPADHLFNRRTHDNIMAQEIPLDRLYGLVAYRGIGDALAAIAAQASAIRNWLAAEG